MRRGLDRFLLGYTGWNGWMVENGDTGKFGNGFFE
jgi:hypothetical protein